MKLVNLANALKRRLEAADRAVDAIVAKSRNLTLRERWALQEGLVSQKWQAWCEFSRSALLASAKGAEVASGALTTSPHAARPEAELTWIASRAANNQGYANVGTLQFKRHEPTWGDPGKVQLVVAALQPSNASTLSSGLLLCSQQARHLQTVRNASAHVNSETLAEVRALATGYIAAPIRHPSEAIYWLDKTTRMFAYRRWSDFLNAAAANAVM